MDERCCPGRERRFARGGVLARQLKSNCLRACVARKVDDARKGWQRWLAVLAGSVGWQVCKGRERHVLAVSGGCSKCRGSVGVCDGCKRGGATEVRAWATSGGVETATRLAHEAAHAGR